MRTRSLSLGLVFCAVALVGCGSGGGSSSDTTLGPLGSTQYKTIPTTSTTVTGGSAVSTPPTLGSGGANTYTVVAGDYLYGIAKKLNCTADKLVNENAWADGLNHPLSPGDTLTVPPDCSGGGATTTQTTQAGSGVTVSGGNSTGTTTGSTIKAGATYTVKNGDTLVGIANQFGTTAQRIVAANGWSDGLNHVIYAGLKIKLPAKTS
jgi:LysM repeat protein